LDITSSQAQFSEKKITEHKMGILIFSATTILNTSYPKKNPARYCPKCENVFA
jgi:hypothetical protein